MQFSLKNKLRLGALVLILTQSAVAAPVKPSDRHEATSKKSGAYIASGFFAGGDKEVQSVKLTGVRRASQGNFERVVFDLKGPSGDSVPYFQAQITPGEQRVVLSFWANVQYDFNAKAVRQVFAKSKKVSSINVVPRVEDGLAIVELGLGEQSQKKIEAFLLSNPARIVIDIL